MTTTPGGGTFTGAALTYVANTMLLPLNGNRPDAPDVVVVLTDGFSGDDVTGPASLLHSMGVQTFVIGVGGCVSDAQLGNIANCEDHVYKLSDFNGLDGITDSIHKQICCNEPKAAPCCPRPQTLVADTSTGHNVYEAVKYRLSPQVQCEAPAEEMPPYPLAPEIPQRAEVNSVNAWVRA
eukprot:XP_002606991.1 hypothetical protein BRAFLDRAFT_64975 [Branchiostoma floridae]